MKLRPAVFLLAVVVSGCGLLPEVEPVVQPDPTADAPQFDEPPQVSINGIPGLRGSFCWRGLCADGVLPDPAMAPAVAPPFEVVLPTGGDIESVAAIGPGAPGQKETLEVPFTGLVIGEVPDGAALLSIFVRFDEGGDATYYWSLDRPQEAP